MAGTDSRFDASAFRDAIHFAMNMGLPQDTDLRATFKWNTDETFINPDSSGSPFDLTESAASSVSFSDVQIPVAVEFLSKGGDTQDTRIGEFDVSRIIITILDDDFTELTQSGVFANQVQLDEALYDIQFVAPPVGLFEVTVYQLHCQAVDEGMTSA